MVWPGSICPPPVSWIGVTVGVGVMVGVTVGVGVMVGVTVGVGVGAEAMVNDRL